MAKEFQKKTGCTVNLVSSGDTGEMLTKLVSEQNKPKADVVVGIPYSMIQTFSLIETDIDPLCVKINDNLLRIPHFGKI